MSSRYAQMVVAALAVFASACEPSSGPEPMQAPDAGADAAAEPDAPPEPFGTVTGACGVLDDELTARTPSELRSDFFFDTEFADADLSLLADGTNTLLEVDNAGGSSRNSEAFVFELLSRCEGAELTFTEKAINYDPDGDKTDFAVSIDDVAIGVSVARAVNFPFNTPFTKDDAHDLLEDKLAGIQESSANVVPEQAWQKQILGLMAYGPGHGEAVKQALAEIDPGLIGDTIVWTIVTNGSDDFVYCDGPCTMR